MMPAVREMDGMIERIGLYIEKFRTKDTPAIGRTTTPLAPLCSIYSLFYSYLINNLLPFHIDSFVATPCKVTNMCRKDTILHYYAGPSLL